LCRSDSPGDVASPSFLVGFSARRGVMVAAAESLAHGYGGPRESSQLESPRGTRSEPAENGAAIGTAGERHRVETTGSDNDFILSILKTAEAGRRQSGATGIPTAVAKYPRTQCLADSCPPTLRKRQETSAAMSDVRSYLSVAPSAREWIVRATAAVFFSVVAIWKRPLLQQRSRARHGDVLERQVQCRRRALFVVWMAGLRRMQEIEVVRRLGAARYGCDQAHGVVGADCRSIAGAGVAGAVALIVVGDRRGLASTRIGRTIEGAAASNACRLRRAPFAERRRASGRSATPAIRTWSAVPRRR